MTIASTSDHRMMGPPLHTPLSTDATPPPFITELLLQGIVKHGYGQWQVIADDKELGLGQQALRLGTRKLQAGLQAKSEGISVLPGDGEDGIGICFIDLSCASEVAGDVERSDGEGSRQAREAAWLQARAEYLAAALLLENADTSQAAWHHPAAAHAHARAHAHVHARASAVASAHPVLAPHMLRSPVPGEPAELHEQRLRIITQYNAVMQQLESVKNLASIMHSQQVREAGVFFFDFQNVLLRMLVSPKT